MSEIKTPETNSTAQNEKPSENFDPNKRVDSKSNENLEKKDEVVNAEEKFNPDKRVERESNEVTEKDIEDYVKDLKENSEYPETIPEKPFESNDLEKLPPERVREMRSEYKSKRAELISEWEKRTGKEWPRYKEDVYDVNGNKIREKGQTYDAHHIKPLEMGGKNTPDNITPIHASVHYDARGVHSIDSPFKRIEGKLKGAEK